MPPTKVVLNLPETFVSSIRIRPGDLSDYIQKTLAVEMYREGVLSLGKAAELANVANKWEMMALLNDRKVAMPYTSDDAEEDLKTLEGVLKQ
ncbi:MAG: UPF0175 family protein [Candidatus Schekmanbacteria bacterium]|nr:UPF0175 family protein [Candidatus Schekmanbacteria bacterium]